LPVKVPGYPKPYLTTMRIKKAHDAVVLLGRKAMGAAYGRVEKRVVTEEDQRERLSGAE